MKRIVLLCGIIILSALSVAAQITGRPVSVKPTVIKTNTDTVITITKVPEPPKTSTIPPATQPAVPPAAQPATQTSQPSTAADYKLTSVRVKITTGKDNKESPSEVYAKFSLPEQVASPYCAFAQWNLQNEMPVNSEVEVGLRKYANASLSITSTKLTMSNPEQLSTGANDISLSDIQRHGARLMIKYYPHLFTDAWRIENVTLLLEFKDSNGNPHPMHGSKTLSFANAKTFLNGMNERYLVCEVGTDLSAMVSYTKK